MLDVQLYVRLTSHCSHNVQMNTNQKVTETSKDLKRLSTLTRGGDKQQKLEVDRITSEFKNIVEKYSKSQQIVAGKMKQVLLINSAVMLEEEQAVSNDQRHDRQTLMQKQGDLQFESEILQEREQRIQQIEADVLDVNQIFRDLSSLVHEQGQTIGEYIMDFLQNGAQLIHLTFRHNREYNRTNVRQC